MDHDGNSTLVASPTRLRGEVPDPPLMLGHHHHEADVQPVPAGQRGLTFWMVFISTLLVDMLSAIDLVRLSWPSSVALRCLSVVLIVYCLVATS